MRSSKFVILGRAHLHPGKLSKEGARSKLLKHAPSLTRRRSGFYGVGPSP